MIFFSDERLRIVQGGILNRVTLDFEKHEIGRITLNEPLFYRLLGLGVITVETKYWTSDFYNMRGIKNPTKVREIIRGVSSGSKNISRYYDIDLGEIEEYQSKKLLN